MQDIPSSARSADAKPHRSLFERLTALIAPEPENRTELLEVLQDAHERNLIDADALAMIEGVFQVSELAARDIMVPRSQMDVIDITTPIEEWLPMVLLTAHSRFPAVEGCRHFAGEGFAALLRRRIVRRARHAARTTIHS
jgi:magnesium and cobalt transporter